ncbi:MAG: hypothetical protein AB1424_03170 [Thermodesulfobacteriota bacterium]
MLQKWRHMELPFLASYSLAADILPFFPGLVHFLGWNRFGYHFLSSWRNSLGIAHTASTAQIFPGRGLITKWEEKYFLTWQKKSFRSCILKY